MKRITPIALLACVVLAGCGGKKSDSKSLVKEITQVCHFYVWDVDKMFTDTIHFSYEYYPDGRMKSATTGESTAGIGDIDHECTIYYEVTEGNYLTMYKEPINEGHASRKRIESYIKLNDNGMVCLQKWQPADGQHYEYDEGNKMVKSYGPASTIDPVTHKIITDTEWVYYIWEDGDQTKKAVETPWESKIEVLYEYTDIPNNTNLVLNGFYGAIESCFTVFRPETGYYGAPLHRHLPKGFHYEMDTKQRPIYICSDHDEKMGEEYVEYFIKYY